MKYKQVISGFELRSLIQIPIPTINTKQNSSLYIYIVVPVTNVCVGFLVAYIFRNISLKTTDKLSLLYVLKSLFLYLVFLVSDLK